MRRRGNARLRHLAVLQSSPLKGRGASGRNLAGGYNVSKPNLDGPRGLKLTITPALSVCTISRSLREKAPRRLLIPKEPHAAHIDHGLPTPIFEIRGDRCHYRPSRRFCAAVANNSSSSPRAPISSAEESAGIFRRHSPATRYAMSHREMIRPSLGMRGRRLRAAGSVEATTRLHDSRRTLYNA